MSEDKKAVTSHLLHRQLIKYSALTLGGLAFEGMTGSQLAAPPTNADGLTSLATTLPVKKWRWMNF